MNEFHIEGGLQKTSSGNLRHLKLKMHFENVPATLFQYIKY